MQTEKTESLLEEQYPQGVVEADRSLVKQRSNAKAKRKTWVLSYVTQIVQSLEDICVNIALSQDSDEQVKHVNRQA